MAEGLGVSRRVGRYEMLREIGRGGMATVHLARQIDLDRFVAVKKLAAFEAADASLALRFLREARLAGSLTHTNIVTVFDYFEHEGKPYIAMEYLEPGSLRPYVGRLGPAQVGGVLEGILAGLAHAHENGVVHRDLKPENIMVSVEGRVKIADFGIAKATDRVRGGSVLTQTGMTVGTPMYMSPEQAMGQDLGPGSDLYSVGCLAFELLAGRVPFEGEAPMAILLRHISEPPPRLADVWPDARPEISDWIARLLVKERSERTASAAEAWTELEEILLAELGPRWRREARLPVVAGQGRGELPLTPAPFHREGLPWDADEGIPGPATPPPHPLPEGPLEPGPIDVPTGAPTPPPLAAAHGDDFETFQPLPRPRPSETPLATPRGFTASADLAPAGPEPTSPHGTATAEPPDSEPADDPGLAPTAMPRRARPEAAAPIASAHPPAGTPSSRHGRWPVVMAGVGATGTAAAVALGTFGGGPAAAPVVTATPPPKATLTAGPVRVVADGGWRPLPSSQRVPGLRLSPAAAAAPAGQAARGTLVVGLAGADANRPTLLPPRLLAALGLRPDASPDRTVVRLGRGIKAYRYAHLHPLGTHYQLTVYAVPTTAGVATLVCRSAVGATRLQPGCDRIVSSLVLHGAGAFALGPDASYGRTLDRALARLGRSLATHGRAVHNARTPAAQARAAGAIADDYRRAKARVADIGRVSPADRQSQAALTDALQAAGRDWSRVRAAAAGGHKHDYRSAANAFRRDQARTARVIAMLRTAGYGALLHARYRPPGAPALAHPRPHWEFRRPALSPTSPIQSPGTSPTGPPSPTATSVPTTLPSSTTAPRVPTIPPRSTPTQPPIIGGN
jgi:hypothetical protein